MRRSRTILTAALVLSMVFSAIPASAAEGIGTEPVQLTSAEVLTESTLSEESAAEVSAVSGDVTAPAEDPQTQNAGETPGELTEAGGEEAAASSETEQETVQPEAEVQQEEAMAAAAAEDAEAEEAEEAEAEEAEAQETLVEYSVHRKGGDWGAPLKDGETEADPSGAVDAIRITVSEAAALGITYEVKVSDEGWQPAQNDGANCGIADGKKHIEAVRISLTGKDKDKYHVYYCTAVTEKGWLGWAKDGETAGSEGYDYSVTDLAVMILPADAAAPEAKGSNTEAVYSKEVVIKYSAHVQRVGWQSYVSDGALGGTSGQGLRVEAFRIKVDGTADLGIRYRSHVQNIGWQDYVENNAVSGTSGRALRVEAFQAELTGNDADKYDLYYCVHVQRAGWLAWAKNGEMSGSEGYALRMEAVKMLILPKGSEAPKNTGSYLLSYLNGNKSYVTYQTQVQRVGWQKAVSSGKTAGTSGQSLRMETLRVSLENQPLAGSVVYSAHVQNIGWQDSVSDGADAGTVGRGLRLEAVKMSLTGDMAKNFNIYYRTHVQNKGWTGWASNGAECGSSGLGYRLEAIQIVVREKAAGAPGSTANAYCDGMAVMKRMINTAQAYSSMTGYLILVNRSTHNVLLCTGRKGNWTKKFFWECGDGAPWTPTIEGVFTTQAKVLYFGHPGEYRCWYATQFYGDYLLHSVKYYDTPAPTRVLDARLGMGVSQGCVRLATANAKWIYDNIPTGTTVVVYH